MQYCLPWRLWESLLFTLLIPRAGLQLTMLFLTPRLCIHPPGHLSSAQMLLCLQKPQGHHQCSMCSLLCSQGMCHSWHWNMYCVLLMSASHTGRCGPIGTNRLLFIPGCSVQPGIWHKRDTHLSKCLPNECHFKYPVCSQDEEWTALSHITGPCLKAEVGSVQSSFWLPVSATFQDRTQPWDALRLAEAVKRTLEHSPTGLLQCLWVPDWRSRL